MAANKVFVSYRHAQGDWVWTHLVSTLEAGGATVLIDKDRFRAGDGVLGQMDALQDEAAATIAVLSAEYLASDYCRHEMERAARKENHRLVPLVRGDCEIPEIIEKPDPLLRVDLRPDAPLDQWGLLLDACEAPAWRRGIRLAVQRLSENRSVNLVADSKHLWSPFLKRVRAQLAGYLGEVDLQDGRTTTRHGLVQMILNQFGYSGTVPKRPEDLVELSQVLNGKSTASRLALLHFDLAARRSTYRLDFFTSLRDLMENRKLALLAQSHEEFANLLPRDHPLSALGPLITTIELRSTSR